MKRFFFFLLFVSSLYARKVLVVSLPGITMEDLIMGQNRNILSLMEKGAIGLVNCRLPKGYPAESAYLAMGSARRLVGKEEARLCFGTDELFLGERGEEVYERYWGFLPPLKTLVHIGFPAIVEYNPSLRGRMGYTLLGDLLHKRGVKTVLLGNADTISELHREASCVLIDSKGIIREGEISKALLKPDPAFPGGLRTDFHILKRELKKHLGDNRFIFIETGDSLRIDSQHPYISEERRKLLIREFLKSVDDLLGYIIPLLRREDILIVISPYPGRWAVEEGKTLSPLIVVGGGMKGLLTSGTTKTEGIVSLYDFAPTIASFFGGAGRLYLGKKMYSQPVGKPLEAILQIRQESWRSWSIHKIISAHLILLTLTFFLLGFLLPLAYPSSRFLALFPLVLPMVLLLLSPFPLNEKEMVFVFPLLTFLLLASCRFFSNKSPLYITLLLLLLIILDTLNKGKLMAGSGIGHSVEEGARYYGIGNEFMGLLVGCMLVINYYYPRLPLYWFLWSFVALLVVAPWWGANWGGFLTTLTCFAYMELSEIKGKRKGYIYLLLCLFFALGLPMLVDILTSKTHIGLAFRGLFLGKVGDLMEIIQRKVVTNIKLFRYSDWTIVLITEGILLFIFYGLRYLLPGEKTPRWLKAVLLSTLVAFALNDSGVVASAFLLIPVVVVILIKEIPVREIKQRLLKQRTLQ